MVKLNENGHHQTTEAVLCANIHTPYHNIFLGAFNIFLSVVASLGNILILIALRKESSLHPPSKLMFCCLTITDLCVGLISQPMFAAELLFQINELRHLCYQFSTFVEIVAFVFSGVSLMTLTAVSVDRLLALSLGLRYRQVVTIRRVGALLSCFWILCLAGSLMKRFWSFTIFLTMVSSIIILCLITSVYCYSKIFLRLRHHQVQIQGHVHQEQPNGGEIPLNIARYRKTVSAALWVQITLVACYLPYALLLSLPSLFSLREASHILGRRYTTSLVYVNSSLNPFLYCWKIKGVRQAVKETLVQLLDYMSC